MTKFPLIAAVLGILALSTVAMAEEISGPIPDPSRVVSIGGSITEIIYDLGEEGRLVGRDTTSVFPEAARKLPDVGYMRALSPEGVLSINPTAIIAVEGSGPREAIDVLKKASVPFVFVPENYTAESVSEKIRIVGKALGVDDKAEKLSAKVEKELAAAKAETKDVKTRKRVLFVLSAAGGKIMAAGTRTAADGIIELAGGDNVVTGYSGYKTMTEEAILTAQPDVILVMDVHGPRAISDAELLANEAIAATPAGQTKNIVRMGGQYLLGFGPRTAQAVHDLAKAFYGSEASQ
ncbi:iron complex transport system substrate-binding protein [Phyllobacterium sp. 1468]|uniref:heme/hemin ABC transporter substrate-binding protein n=1 Tax=Phyllobacterium sp. 1468 TaxID=2817759 RepID=UPI00285DE53D|nr:ABC transporter substrate-binding protein [Phyllobacterium sp. 1468]MDR6635355.1 iron complex transport system substrate-binding protein [Phyllobacterium sp. 1468]